MIVRPIPITKPGPLWSQREYVACQALRIGFSAHRHGDIKQAFHYHFPSIGCTTLIVNAAGVERAIDHGFEPGLDWISQCAAALTKELQ